MPRLDFCQVQVSGSWFHASAMTTMNKIPTRCTIVLKSIPTHRHTKATVVTDQSWKIQPTQQHTVTGGCMCRIRRLLMMGARVPETCRAE
jgi:hypothetical protein